MKKKTNMLSMILFLLFSIFTFTNLVNATTGQVTISGTHNYDYAKEVYKLVNKERAEAGKKALNMDATLTEAAMKRAEEIGVFFSHTRANDTKYFSILGEYGITYSYAGENIAFGQVSPSEVMNSWMNSSGHKANILDEGNSGFTTIGIGHYSDGYYNYWVQLFVKNPNLKEPVVKTGTMSGNYKVEVADKYFFVLSDFYDLYDLQHDEMNYNIIYINETDNVLKYNQPFIVNFGLCNLESISEDCLVSIQNTDIEWRSDKGNVTVNQNGQVTGRKYGPDVVHAKVGDISNAYPIFVGNKIENIEMKDSLTIEEGKIISLDELAVTVIPDESAYYGFFIDVSDENIITIDVEQEMIVAHEAGQAIITVEAYDKEYRKYLKECVVTVTEESHEVPIIDINLNKTTLEMLPEAQEKLTAIINPDNTTEDKTLTWTSSDETIATVDNNGVITAIKAGTVTITATTSKGLSTKCVVKVLKPIDSFEVSESEIILNKGEDTTLDTIIEPADAEENKEITWSSADEEIATVDTTGKITALNKGNTTITGTLMNGMKVTVKVTVKVPLESIAINEQNLQIEKGQTTNLTLSYSPEDNSNENTTLWHSSDGNIVTIDNNGNIKGIGKGTATITAQVGQLTATTTITVITPIENISLDKTTLELNVDETYKVKATVTPEEADYDRIIFTSSNEEIATIDESGKITAIKSGSVTITAQVGTKKATMTVTVKNPIKGISLSETQVDLLKGKNKVLQAIITPNDSDEDMTVTWTSSDEAVATIDTTGKITTLHQGTTIITATLKNGMKAQAVINVIEKPIESITIYRTTYNLIVGSNTEKIIVKINPEDTTDEYVIKYLVQDSDVISINEDGTITALKEGTTKVNVKVGSFSKEVTVNVKDIPLKNIIVKIPTNKVEIGDVVNITVQPEPINTTIKYNLTYESSDETIATVDRNGNVLGIKTGSVTITVKTNTGLEQKIEVEVVKPEEKPLQPEKPSIPGTPTVNKPVDKEEDNNPDTSSDKKAFIELIKLFVISFIGLVAVIFLSKKYKKQS